MITKQKQLWMQSFGDSPETVDDFFTTGYKQENSAVLCVENQLVSALYWLDYTWEKETFAYIYAVATEQTFRGQGYGRRLMEEAHRTLQVRGYAGAILVPAEAHLVRWYEKQGYETFYRAKKQTVASGKKIPVTEISPRQYDKLRKNFLPDEPQPGKEVYGYFATYGKYYQADTCIFAASCREDTAYFQEYLGKQEKLPDAVAALGAKRGVVTQPDGQTPFAMIHRFADGLVPDYFSFALD